MDFWILMIALFVTLFLAFKSLLGIIYKEMYFNKSVTFSQYKPFKHYSGKQAIIWGIIFFLTWSFISAFLVYISIENTVVTTPIYILVIMTIMILTLIAAMFDKKFFKRYKKKFMGF